MDGSQTLIDIDNRNIWIPAMLGPYVISRLYPLSLSHPHPVPHCLVPHLSPSLAPPSCCCHVHFLSVFIFFISVNFLCCPLQRSHNLYMNPTGWISRGATAIDESQRWSTSTTSAFGFNFLSVFKKKFLFTLPSLLSDLFPHFLYPCSALHAPLSTPNSPLSSHQHPLFPLPPLASFPLPFQESPSPPSRAPLSMLLSPSLTAWSQLLFARDPSGS